MACELIELGAAMACKLSLQNTAGATSDPMADAASEVDAGGLDGEVVASRFPPLPGEFFWLERVSFLAGTRPAKGCNQ